MYDNQNVTMTQDEWNDIRGPLLTRPEVLMRLQEYPEIYEEYLKLSEEFQEEFLAFTMGVQGVKMTYDAFFKHIFDPELRQANVEGFLSACFGEEVKILEVLPNESKRMTEESSLLILDMLVRLRSGDLVNVEVQRLGYYFPGQRCACYSSDLVMRQYLMLKAQCEEEKKWFSYGDVKKVYTIILIQKSISEFHRFPDDYIHRSQQTFDTGLKLDLLQEYMLVPLDIFLKIQHNKISELDAWLYFIASDKMEDIERICNMYPMFRELYREVFRFRFNPKELVSMYSDALRILDEGTVQYMIDDMKKTIEEQSEELKGKDTLLEQKNALLEELNCRIEELQAQIATMQKHTE